MYESSLHRNDDRFHIDEANFANSQQCRDDDIEPRYVPDPWDRCDRVAPAFGELARSQKTFYYPLSSCTLSWAPIGTQGSVVGCKSQAGVISTECKWNRGVSDFAAYQCRQIATSPESVMSVDQHDACILSLDPAVGMAKFSCDLLR